MLALLGLVGLAVAGTAFVGVFPATDEDANPDAAIPDKPDTPTQDAPDLLSQLDDTPVGDLVRGEVIVGGTLDDDLAGTEGPDYLAGQDGDDVLSGGLGDDQMHGNDGDDEIKADAGADLAFGYLGDDWMTGGDGDDTLHGGSGADVLDGGDGDDEMLGGYGDDTLFGGAGQDQLQGSDGDDTLDGTAGEVVAERDYLNGSEGDDRLIGNTGDVMTGGEGADQFAVEAGADGAILIMDYSSDDTLQLYFEGDAPTLSTERSETGLTLLANGVPVAEMYGVQTLDLSSVQLIAS